MEFNLISCRPKSILKELREKFPDENWKAEKAGFGWTYRNNKGEHAWWCSALAPQYDGYDDSFRREFWIYRKNKPPESLW